MAKRCWLWGGLLALCASLTFHDAAQAAASKHKKPAQSEAAEPAQAAGAQGAWTLQKTKDGLALIYSSAESGNEVIAFLCAPRSGNITIDVPIASSKASPDQGEPLYLTVGGVRSSFGAVVNEDPTTAGLMLSVIVTPRNPMFTYFDSPGGMRVEGRGFGKNVPLRAISAKLHEFLAACKR